MKGLEGWQLLYSSSEVQKTIWKMSEEIRNTSLSDRLIIIAILKGGCWTAYNLVNHLNNVDDLRIGHLGISSYGNGRKPDQMFVTSTLDLTFEDIHDADVWLVDDIHDTGATMRRSIEIVRLMQPRSLKTATLVNRIKKDGEKPTIAGFEYWGDEFLAGCGMGCGDLYRHYNSIYIVPNRGE